MADLRVMEENTGARAEFPHIGQPELSSPWNTPRTRLGADSRAQPREEPGMDREERIRQRAHEI
ncbi:hypothetical protein CK228_28460 [Mesorhizobium sp. WSM4312]|nr:hypothetical protein CK228_28460 [Mesorhizobium sp. WSM4312]